jgi:hypothetical protein
MSQLSRRAFLTDVGRGMLVASLGGSVLSDLGLSWAYAGPGAEPLSFGKLEALAAFMQETSAAKLQPLLVAKLRAGQCDLGQLVAAASLANARQFGGEDYVGYHALMAMAPAHQMSRELPPTHQALPVLKVLYRNTHHIERSGGRRYEVLHTVEPARPTTDRLPGEVLRDATRAADMEAAEGTFAGLARGSIGEAYNHLQYAVHDDTEVHRVVLAHRAWSLIDLVGQENAHTLLRESVRFCVDAEKQRIARGRPEPEIRTVLPQLLDTYELHDRELGDRHLEDAAVLELSETIYDSRPSQAAEAAAAALARGAAPEGVGEAISLAANALELRDRSRRVHGACSGVHASDSAHAWRAIARVTDARNACASLIVAAHHISKGGRYDAEPYPLGEHIESVRATDSGELLGVLREAIRSNDQERACAAVFRYGELGHCEDDVFDVLRRFAISEDGRLHGEKYYVTVREEFAHTRPAYRWRHLVGLARATASAYGYSVDDQPGHRAPGYEEACQLLGVEA